MGRNTSLLEAQNALEAVMISCLVFQSWFRTSSNHKYPGW